MLHVQHANNVYPWPYEEGMRRRGKYLFDILKLYLQPKDCVLDAGCGHSPLADYIVKFGCQIRGFDVSSIPIEAVRKRVPEGRWRQAAYETAEIGTFSILLLTGLTGHIQYASFISFLEKALKERPRIIFVDTVMKVTKKRNYTKLATTLATFIVGHRYENVFFKRRGDSFCQVFVKEER